MSFTANGSQFVLLFGQLPAYIYFNKYFKCIFCILKCIKKKHFQVISTHLLCQTIILSS